MLNINYKIVYSVLLLNAASRLPNPTPVEGGGGGWGGRIYPGSRPAGPIALTRVRIRIPHPNVRTQYIYMDKSFRNILRPYIKSSYGTSNQSSRP